MDETKKVYDLIVLGGGPAGIVGAGTATSFGRTVAIVDNHHELGGAGVNTGTVPSKTLRETALALSGIRSRNLYGVDLSLRREATVADFLRHEKHVKNGLNESVTQQLEASQTDIIYGDGSFEPADSHTVRVKQKSVSGEPPPDLLLHAEHILIATGSSPIRPALFPFGTPEVYDSDTILDLDRIPKSIAIVGAGAVGSEYACTFATLGTTVHLIDGKDRLLPFLDSEISRSLAAAMSRAGITFHWNEHVQSCSASGDGRLALALSSGATLSVEAVLVAAGRKSNTDALNLPSVGVETGDRGIVKVDDHFRTSVPHVYAAGDVIGFPALASTGVQQARFAVRDALGLKLPWHGLTLLPTGVYTIPEVSMVGETEESLQQKGIDYVAGCAPYSKSARGRIIGDSEGYLKLLFGPKDKMQLLGVHAIGEQATELIHIGLIAMHSQASAHIFDEACFNIPTLGTLYKVAALDALMRAG